MEKPKIVELLGNRGARFCSALVALLIEILIENIDEKLVHERPFCLLQG